ncbi:MAG: hypothetical protein QOI95_2517 [Acidimicrobiaceae bacterium]|jgi:O-antigen ligase
MSIHLPGTVTARRHRFSASERVVLSCGLGIAVVFIVSLFGKPQYGVPILLVPLLYVFVRNSKRDAAAVLSLHVCLLILIPSVLIIEPLGGSGTPANMLGVGMLWWWLLSRFVLGSGIRVARSPVRTCVFLLGLAILASYAALAFRPIIPIEISAADRGILFFAGCAGITLLATDGLASRDRINTLLRRLVALVTVLAGIGLYQFVTNFDINDVLKVPGLTQNQQLNDLVHRASFNRVAGTAAHPIEFGVVMAMVFPIALHFALHASVKTRWRWWIAVALIATGIPLSLSRSAVISVALALIILMPTWPRDRIKRALVLGGSFLAVMQVAIPGLLDAVSGLFLNISSDPSTTSRTEDYAVFARIFTEQPVFGRGFFTFLPNVYTTFDNEYLLALVEIGVVGFLALVALLFAGMSAGRAARKASADEETRHLGQALAASIAAGALALATFDALSFPMASGTLFLLIGIAGGLRRVARAPVSVDDEDQAAVTSGA